MSRRKLLSLILVIAMVMSSFSFTFAGQETDTGQTTSAPATYSDVNSHWAKDAIYKWSGYGIIKGYNRLFRPNDSITRGEMAVILDNMMDYQATAANTFTDLKNGQFYTDSVLKANGAGIIKGSGNAIRPTDKITREEAAVMLGRAFAVKESAIENADFNDSSSISSWAKSYVTAMASKGYLKCSNNNFNPKTQITRAEIVTIIDNVVKAYYTEAGTYTDNVNGTAVIKVKGVTLKGVTVSENLIIAEGVGQGDVTLDIVTVKGETVVRGGGENSVHITGASSITSIRIEKVHGKIRIAISDGITVQEVEVAEGEEIIITGTVGTVEVVAPNTTIVAADANVGSMNVESTASNTNIQTQSGSTIGIVTAQTQISVSGQGTVSQVNLNEGADNSRITTPNTKISVDEGVTGATGGGGTSIPAGSIGTNNSSGNGASVRDSEANGGGRRGGSFNQDQAAPISLTGVAPTSLANNNGKITGTTVAMEYKLATAGIYTACTDTETTGLSAGNYLVRYAAKTGYNAGSTVAVTVPAYIPTPEEAANASIFAAKELLREAEPITVSEATDTNLLTKLYAIEGMSETGVTLSVNDSNNANITTDGAITYTHIQVSDAVKIRISKLNGEDILITIEVIVPAHILTAEELANAAINTAKSLIPASMTLVETSDSNLLNVLNAIDGMEAAGVTLSIDSATIHNANIASNGAATYTDSEVTGNVTIKINKLNGTEQTATILVTVPAHILTPEEVANASIFAAKELLREAEPITVSEATDTNLLTKLYAIEGMAATGVTLSIDVSNSPCIATNGAITYPDVPNFFTPLVKIRISKLNGDDILITIEIIVPVHVPIAEGLANSSITIAKGLIPSSKTLVAILISNNSPKFQTKADWLQLIFTRG